MALFDEMTTYVTQTMEYGDTQPTNSSEIQEMVAYYRCISHTLRLYVTPVILFGGTLGNLMTIVVVLSHHFRHHPSSVPLITLAFVDIGVLYFNLLDVWLGALLGDHQGRLQYTRGMSSAGCKFSTFITLFLTQCSSWILVLINIDRVISVWKPLKARTWCTRRRLAIALTSIMGVLGVISLHLFWTTGYFPERQFDKCQYDDDLLGVHGTTAWLTIDASLFVFIPFVLILGCNVYIITALIKARRRREQRLDVQLSSPSSSTGVFSLQHQQQQHQNNTRSITLMLITISIVFLLTTSPLTICYQFYDVLMIHFEQDPVGKALWYDLVINTVLVLVCYSNNALNFLLYCISGSKFREALADVCAGRVGRRYRRQSTIDAWTIRTSMDYLGPSSNGGGGLGGSLGVLGTPYTTRRSGPLYINGSGTGVGSSRAGSGSPGATPFFTKRFPFFSVIAGTSTTPSLMHVTGQGHHGKAGLVGYPAPTRRLSDYPNRNNVIMYPPRSVSSPDISRFKV